MECLGQAIGDVDLAMQHGRPELIAFAVIQPSLGSHFTVMLLNVGQPLLAVGQPVTTFINHHRCRVGEIVKEGCRLLPGQPHQPTHTFRCSTLQQLFCGLLAEKLFQSIRHQSAQLIGNEGTEAGRRESQSIDGVQRPLAGRVEFPQLVELFAKKFKSNRKFTADREDVDDVSSTAPASLLLNRRHALVAKVSQRLGQLLKIDFITSVQRARRALQCIRGREMRLQTTFCRHDRPGRAIRLTQQIT